MAKKLHEERKYEKVKTHKKTKKIQATGDNCFIKQRFIASIKLIKISLII